MELIGSLDCGSIIVEMALSLAGVPVTVTDIPYLREGPARDRLLRLNPLGQVPTLVLNDGAVMTESAAIILHLHDLRPEAGLLPEAGAIDRPLVLNRLVWLVAAIYPTFTYGDDPGRWTSAGDAAQALRHRTNLHREALFRGWNAEFGRGPFARGTSLSALDLYLIAMIAWPRLVTAADAAAAHPALAPVVARHSAKAA